MSRVLVLNYEFPPLGGGGGVAAKKIATDYIKEGYCVDYVTSGHPDLPSYEVVDGINVYRVPVRRQNKNTASLSSMLAYPVSALPRCLKLCHQYDYEFVNTHFAVPSGPLGVLVTTLYDIDHVLSIHGGDIHDPTKNFSPHNQWYLRMIVSTVLNRADYVIAQSTNTKENALKYYDVDERTDIKVIPLPYEQYDFQSVPRSELGLDEDTTYLVSVGRLIERKGYRYFIKALSLLDDEFEAIIIGKGPLRDELEEFAHSIGVSDRVIFPGYVSENRKFQYLECADIYVLSSIHEGFGIVLQEAMQVDLPIVATDTGGQRDLVSEGENGFLVSAQDSEILAKAIRKASKTDFYLNRMKGCGSDYSKKIIDRI